MHHFQYKQKEGTEVLHGENVDLETLAQAVGTPFYCYSLATLKRHFRVFDEAFSEIPHLVCYSVKANSNLAVLNLFSGLGGGFDIVSGGELQRVLKAGGDPQRVVFSGVGKTRQEMALAMQTNILLFNVESEAELSVLNAVAGEMGKKVPIALRVNPDIDPKTHPYISTGLRKAKFGIDITYATALFEKARDLPNLDPVGVDCHIGSQLTEMEPFMATLDSLHDLIAELRSKGISIQYLDIGGGLGITYREEKPPHPDEYAKAIVPRVRKMNVTLLMEPGRVIVGNAGILVSKVLYHKSTQAKNFVIVDAGMNDLIRPALYQAYQEVLPVRKNSHGEMTADVVGPICESGDFFALDRKIARVEPGELIAVMSAGAYGFSMSSTYNTRPRVPEVLVDGRKFHVIRERETVDSLMRGERIPLASATKPIHSAFRIPFTKMHGNGNDFVVIDNRHLAHENLPWEEISRRLCNRQFGIGADQLLLLENPDTADLAARMSIYDADGSRVEMCGNGLRALALYLWDENIYHKPLMKIATMERVVTVERLKDHRFRVDMGEPILDGRKIPVAADGQIVNHALQIAAKNYKITCVSMGNPHAVIYLDAKVKEYPVTQEGPVIEHHAFFPKRVNVEFVEVISTREVNARVWERGTGETLACGSGACAIVVAGVLTGKTDRHLVVHLPGGPLELEWREKENHVYLTGEAKRVFDGELDLKEVFA